MQQRHAHPLLALGAAAFLTACSGPDTGEVDAAAADRAPGVYAMEVPALDGSAVDLASYRGKVSLVVNVASRCGYTGQYAGLQKLHQEFSDRGFQVLGIPCNDFWGQEPGSPEEIREFCTAEYGVTFPMFAKVRIKEAPSPVYARLIEASGKTPNWNFCKYLVDKDGKVIGFWKSGTRPDDATLRAAIEAALAGQKVELVPK